MRVARLWLPRTGCRFAFPGVELRGPWTGGCPGSKPLDVIRQAGREVGIPHLTIIGFRKTISTYAKVWGISQEARMKLLGHTSVRTAEEWYDEDDVEVLRGVVGRICYG